MRKRACSSLSRHSLVTFAVDSGYPAHVAEAALQHLAKKLRTSNVQQINSNDHAIEYFNILEQQQDTGPCSSTDRPAAAPTHVSEEEQQQQTDLEDDSGDEPLQLRRGAAAASQQPKRRRLRRVAAPSDDDSTQPQQQSQQQQPQQRGPQHAPQEQFAVNPAAVRTQGQAARGGASRPAATKAGTAANGFSGKEGSSAAGKQQALDRFFVKQTAAVPAAATRPPHTVAHRQQQPQHTPAAVGAALAANSDSDSDLVVTGQRPGRPSAPLYINLGSQVSDSPHRPYQQQPAPRQGQPRNSSRLQPPQQQQQQQGMDDEPWLQPVSSGPPWAPAAAAAGGFEGALVPPGSAAPVAAAGGDPGAGSGQVAPWHAPLTAEESELDLVDLVARRVFGHRGFRPKQREIIDAAVAQQDIFVLMPTGGGKSLCYQLPAVVSKGVTVVVTPLLSLMQDQVRALVTHPLGGVPATYLSSQQGAIDSAAVKRELRKAERGRCPTCKLLYVTPEQLAKSELLQSLLKVLMQQELLARVVIDEAHCLSMWGHDFRPDYKNMNIKENFPGVPIMALTATATSQVQRDILSVLRIPQARVFKTSFERANLTFRVVPKLAGMAEDGEEPLALLRLRLYCASKGAGAAGIVYCLSRDESEQVAAHLRDWGNLAAAHYHAGMTHKQRMQVQNKFFSGEVRIIVATIAFGMGIDKPDVRYVVHFTLSKSMEGYYQEAGRAGRDGLPSECVLMYQARDVGRLSNMISRPQRGRKRSQGDKDRQLLEHMVEYCQDTATCRHTALLRYFGEQQGGGRCDTSCDVCLGQVVPLQVPAKKGRRGSREQAAAGVAQAGVEDDEDWLVEDDQERAAVGPSDAVSDGADPELHWPQQEHGGDPWQEPSSGEELEGPGEGHAPRGAAAGAWEHGRARQNAAPRFAAASTLLPADAGVAGAPPSTSGLGSAGGLGLHHGLPAAGMPEIGGSSKRPPLQQRPAPQAQPGDGPQAAGAFDHGSAWSVPACRGFMKASALLQERKGSK